MKQTNTILTTAQPDSSQSSTANPQPVATVQQAKAKPAAEQVTTPVRTSEIPVTLLRPVDTVTVDTTETDTVKFFTCWFDSTEAPFAIQEPLQRKSMFASNEHVSDLVTPVKRTDNTPGGWVFGVIILLIVFISLYINNQKFKIKDIFRSLFDSRALDRVFRESNIRPRSLLPMTGIYLGTLALCAVRIMKQYAFYMDLNEVQLFLILLGGLVVFILLKTGIIKLFGVLFESPSSIWLYISSNYLFYFVGGLTVTPLLLLIFYTPNAGDIPLKIALGIATILFIVRIIRGLQLILTNSKSSKLYLFYYLCIFEIVPILILAKVLIS